MYVNPSYCAWHVVGLQCNSYYIPITAPQVTSLEGRKLGPSTLWESVLSIAGRLGEQNSPISYEVKVSSPIFPLPGHV